MSILCLCDRKPLIVRSLTRKQPSRPWQKVAKPPTGSVGALSQQKPKGHGGEEQQDDDVQGPVAHDARDDELNPRRQVQGFGYRSEG